MMKHLITLLSATAIACNAYADRCQISSPGNHISVEFNNDYGVALYSVKVDGEYLLKPGRLGIVTTDWSYSDKGKATVEKNTFDETWTQPWGENKTYRNHYNEMSVALDGGKMTVRFRVFDDGMAFRYEINSGCDSLAVTDELTQFHFATDGETWSIPSNFESYELEYRDMPLSKVQDANTPFTFCTANGIYGSVHEAALYDYPEMNLRRDVTNILKADLAPLPDGVKAYIPGKFTTPWRTVQIGPTATSLINSAMILNLNEPCKITDTAWIKPQKYIGVWWGMHLGTQVWTPGARHGATTVNAIKYIDFAAANNIQGVFFEGWNLGWDSWGGKQHFDYIKSTPDFDIEYVARYAARKGVELWAHNETGGNIPEYEAALDSAYTYYRSLGIHTIKTGYAGGFTTGYYHHSQYGVKHYQKVVETAAKYEMMLDVHEPIKETGIRRTWPNMMTREGARGMEWNAWSKGNSADYLCILPFTRMLAGPMDYTPGIFDINYSRAKADPGRIEWNGPNRECCIKTTLARQIANWVIIYSPLQMAADQIENYEGHEAFQFFRDFDADCDWSEALAGEIGKYIVIARRAGEKYFVGAGTNSEQRAIELPLTFLKKGVKYKATIYSDVAGSPDKVDIIKKTVTFSDSLQIKMAATGGQAISFIPEK